MAWSAAALVSVANGLHRLCALRAVFLVCLAIVVTRRDEGWSGEHHGPPGPSSRSRSIALPAALLPPCRGLGGSHQDHVQSRSWVSLLRSLSRPFS